MMKTTKASITRFLSAQKIAIAGVTRDPKEFGYQIFEKLRSTGKEVLIVHPIAGQIGGQPCYKSIGELPDDVHHLVIVTSKKNTPRVVEDALAKKIDNIWIQQMSATPEAIALARTKTANLITGECIFMHMDPVKGVHHFHRSIRRLFGLMPG